MLLRILFLAALVRLLIHSERPVLCAALYGGGATLLGLAMGGGLAAVGYGGLAFGLALLYFWILSRLECGSMVWWLVALGGLAIGLV